MSAGIDKLVAMAKERGMQGQLTHWSKADVWWFEGTLPLELLQAGYADPALDYYEHAATPHLRANVGFIDGDANVAISFDKMKDHDAEN